MRYEPLGSVTKAKAPEREAMRLPFNRCAYLHLGSDVALPLRCSISVVPIQGGSHRGFEIFKAHGAFGGVDQLCVRTNQRSERR